MIEKTYRNLDSQLLKQLCNAKELSANDLISLTFTLYSAIKPLRISSWYHNENNHGPASTYGTQSSSIENPAQFLHVLRTLELKKLASAVWICTELPEGNCFSTNTQCLIRVTASHKEYPLEILIELDQTPDNIDLFTAFLERLSSYLQLYDEKCAITRKSKRLDELSASFCQLQSQALIIDRSLQIITKSKGFSLQLPPKTSTQESTLATNYMKPEERESFTRTITTVLKAQIEKIFHVFLYTDNNWKRVKLKISPVGKGAALLQVLPDHTSTVRAQDEQQLALFTTLNPFPVIQFDHSGKILFANPSAIRTFSIQQEYGEYLTLCIPQFTLGDLQSCIENGSIISKTGCCKNKTFQFVARGAPGLGYGLLYGIDVTERIKAEEQLANSHQFLRKIIDTNPNLIFVKDADGRFTLANQSVADIYGTTIEDIVGKTDSDFNEQPDEVEAFRQNDLEVIHHQRELIINEEQITDAAGNIRWLQTVKKPLRTLDDNIHVLGVATDITALKQLQMQLNQSQKMEAVGQLAGGIAHDFNNLLTGILGYTNLLVSEGTIAEPALHATRMIERAALQASQLTQKLLGFARQGKHQHIAVDIHETVSEVVQLLKRTVEENIQIVLQLDSSAGHVLGDPVQMQQIIMNLVINARDAIQESDTKEGTIEIKTIAIPAHAAKRLTHVPLDNKKYLHLTIRDTGCGIPAELHEKIFEPFFTTKDPSRGTGMGLAMVYGIVQNHGGSLSVESSEGSGSVFSVYLPIAEKLSDHVIPVITKTHLGQGQILLVDDHSMIRDVTSQMLSNLGYTVITAENGVKALEYYQEHALDIDLIILDMIMPKMSALECFQRFKRINPNVRVILSTGYVNNNRVQEILNEGMSGFVQKPYHLHELSKVVADALKQHIEYQN